MIRIFLMRKRRTVSQTPTWTCSTRKSFLLSRCCLLQMEKLAKKSVSSFFEHAIDHLHSQSQLLIWLKFHIKNLKILKSVCVLRKHLKQEPLETWVLGTLRHDENWGIGRWAMKHISKLDKVNCAKLWGVLWTLDSGHFMLHDALMMRWWCTNDALMMH